MLHVIEGVRASGKSHLINKFFEQNTDPDVVYYKFQFADYLVNLNMKDQEAGPGGHYFSIANVLSMLELNKTLLNDKFVVFDRALISAYVWSMYRERMSEPRLMRELNAIMKSDLYSDVSILYVDRPENIETKERGKDYFCQFENASEEKYWFDTVISENQEHIKDGNRNNSMWRMTNNFDEASVDTFCQVVNQAVAEWKKTREVK